MDYTNIHKLINYTRATYKIMDEEWKKSVLELGITQAEHHLLTIVYYEKKTSMSKLAQLGLIDISTVMQVTNRLKQKELIIIEKDESDRRVSYVILTKLGYEKVKKSQETTFKLQAYIEKFAELSKENREFIEKLASFHKELNQHFYGNEFVQWVEKSSKNDAM
ncbi:MarR family winged helix-turn-helix transcriptional regulator [Alkalihalobacterium elongatum]|uniref:MarR family winged helix-turn-helix transcriptional regulator n=1 Tax=Alkalihalobacterium elongatum TaxID=2675466 RepID=UPI001C1F3392|nr:MarR family transcriptional regulator [Alkalihalobacterium elongatum]